MTRTSQCKTTLIPTCVLLLLVFILQSTRIYAQVAQPPEPAFPVGLTTENPPVFAMPGLVEAYDPYVKFRWVIRDLSSGELIGRYPLDLAGNTSAIPSLDTSHKYRWLFQGRIVNPPPRDFPLPPNLGYQWGTAEQADFYFADLPPTPQAPTNLTPEGLMSGETALSWDVVSGAVEYRVILIDRTLGEVVFRFNTATNSASVPAHLDHTHRWRWRVRAKGTAGWGEMSAPVDIHFDELPDPPVAPTPVSPKKLSDDYLVFRWEPVQDAIKYRVVAIDITEHKRVIGTRVSVEGNGYGPATYDARNWLVSNGSGDHRFKWRVRAQNSNGWGEFSEWTEFHFGDLPEKPSIPVPTTSEYNSPYPELSWDYAPSEGGPADLFQVVVYDLSARESVEKQTTLSEVYRVSTYLDSTRRYRWRVRAKNNAGWGEFTDWEEFHYFDLPALPKGTSLISPLFNVQVAPERFRWEPKQGAWEYLFVLVNTESGDVLREKTVEPKFVPANLPLELNTKYRWRVRSRNNAGWGAFSQWASFIVGGNPTISINETQIARTKDLRLKHISGKFSGFGSPSVKVNEELACVFKDRFFVNNIAASENGHYTATLYGDGQQQASVNASVQDSERHLSDMEISNYCGIAPLTVHFSLVGPSPQIEKIELDSNGDGEFNQEINLDAGAASFTYQEVGVHGPKVRISLTNGDKIIRRFFVIAKGYTEAMRPFVSVWAEYLEHLSSGNLNQALNHFTPGGRERYSNLLKPLMPYLVNADKEFSGIVPIYIRSRYAEFLFGTDYRSERDAFIVTFKRGPAGDWLIEGM